MQIKTVIRRCTNMSKGMKLARQRLEEADEHVEQLGNGVGPVKRIVGCSESLQ